MTKELWAYVILACAALAVNTVSLNIGVTPDRGEEAVFVEDFNSPTLDLKTWLVAKKQWGGIGVNGGVVPENVSVVDGKLVLEAHGDLYDGPVKGVNRFGIPMAHGRRVGAAIATREYFGSGRFEVRAKIAPKLGVCSSFFTLHYDETSLADGAHPAGSGDGSVINHEINIELPGRPQPDAVSDVSFKHGLFNTWRGVEPGQYHDGYVLLPRPVDDGRYHVYRFDWHTGDDSPTGQPRVDFYIDDQLIHTSPAHIPTRAGRFWIGLWFPNKWAGQPRFDQTKMYVDWVRITPYREPGDQHAPESYPDDGWAAPDEVPAASNNPSQAWMSLPRSSSVAMTVENFDSDERTTRRGSLYNTFQRAPSSAVATATRDHRVGDDGRSLKISYQKDPRGWCGLWMRFVPENKVLDATAYRYLTFYVKGQRGGEDFDVGLSWDRAWSEDRDAKPVGNIRDFLPNGVTDRWQKVRIPLSQALGLDLNVMSGFAVICREGSSDIYIDEIRLEG